MGSVAGAIAPFSLFVRITLVDTSKIIRLPFTDVPGFVGLLVAVPVMMFIASKVPVLNKLTR